MGSLLVNKKCGAVEKGFEEERRPFQDPLHALARAYHFQKGMVAFGTVAIHKGAHRSDTERGHDGFGDEGNALVVLGRLQTTHVAFDDRLNGRKRRMFDVEERPSTGRDAI